MLVCSGQLTDRLAHGDRFSEVSAQQIPGGLPAITLDQTAQGQNGLSAREGPSHAGLLQALGEVLENALVFTPAGEEITVEAGSDGQVWATIAVTDTGPGIPPDEQDKVFDRFFRGHLTEAGDIPGTGLGLSIAHEILLAHGGRITVESGETGSTFRLWLPADDAE